MPAALLTMVGKPGCHLCDAARETVTTVVAGFAPGEVEFEEKSIFDDAELHDLYVEEIPVILINNRVHNIYRVDATRLRTALMEAIA